MNYDTNQAIQIVKELYPNSENITGIGHHELKRHMVFRFEVDGVFLVIKLYFTADRWNREVASLRLLESEIMPLRLIQYGVCNEVEYVVMNYIDAMMLCDVLEIDSEKVYYESGIQLAKIHQANTFEQFGILNHDLSFKIGFDSWNEYYLYESNRHLTNLKKHKHPNQKLIDDAITMFLDTRKQMSGNYVPVLTHNDYGDRNIFVQDSDYITIIDFELSCVQDVYRELAFIEYQLKKRSSTAFDNFIQGYQTVREFNSELFHKNRRLYYLHFALAICSWSLTIDPIHYQEGVQLLEYTLGIRK